VDDRVAPARSHLVEQRLEPCPRVRRRVAAEREEARDLENGPALWGDPAGVGLDRQVQRLVDAEHQ
jgi:anti-sigma factor RsiW